jgi:hypothetical protein
MISSRQSSVSLKTATCQLPSQSPTVAVRLRPPITKNAFRPQKSALLRTENLVSYVSVAWGKVNQSLPSELPTAEPKQVPSPSVRQFDYLVIGSGVAGLTYAIKTAQYGKVAVITKDYASEGCTQYAQGGVCAVLDQSDSVQDHINDTVVAGAFLNDVK